MHASTTAAAAATATASARCRPHHRHRHHHCHRFHHHHEVASGLKRCGGQACASSCCRRHSTRLSRCIKTATRRYPLMWPLALRDREATGSIARVGGRPRTRVGAGLALLSIGLQVAEVTNVSNPLPAAYSCSRGPGSKIYEASARADQSEHESPGSSRH